jgi:uncharacterized membrane protein
MNTKFNKEEGIILALSIFLMAIIAGILNNIAFALLILNPYSTILLLSILELGILIGIMSEKYKNNKRG